VYVWKPERRSIFASGIDTQVTKIISLAGSLPYNEENYVTIQRHPFWKYDHVWIFNDAVLTAELLSVEWNEKDGTYSKVVMVEK